MTEKELVEGVLAASELVFEKIAERRGKFYVKENFEAIAAVVSMTMATIMDNFKVSQQTLQSVVEAKKQKKIKKMAEEQGVEWTEKDDEDDIGGKA
jgi:hypothetical protein